MVRLGRRAWETVLGPGGESGAPDISGVSQLPRTVSAGAPAPLPAPAPSSLHLHPPPCTCTLLPAPAPSSLHLHSLHTPTTFRQSPHSTKLDISANTGKWRQHTTHWWLSVATPDTPGWRQWVNTGCGGGLGDPTYPADMQTCLLGSPVAQGPDMDLKASQWSEQHHVTAHLPLTNWTGFVKWPNWRESSVSSQVTAPMCTVRTVI